MAKRGRLSNGLAFAASDTKAYLTAVDSCLVIHKIDKIRGHLGAVTCMHLHVHGPIFTTPPVLVNFHTN